MGYTTAAPPDPVRTSDRPARAPRRLTALDGLRFAAAVAVLFYHYFASNHDAWGGQGTVDLFPHLQPLAVFGSFGVQLFFVISGFVILMSAWGRDVRGFTASRVARLFPAYWVSVALMLVLLLVVAPGQKDVTVGDAAANLTMFQRALGVHDLEAVYWTLWSELRFYVLVGILLAVGLTRERVLAFATLWPVAGTIAVQAKSELWSTVLVGADAPLFAGGMVLFLLTRRPRSLLLWLALGLNVALAGVISGRTQALRIASSAEIDIGPATYWTAIVVCFALVALVTLTPLSRIAWGWLTVVGALTYPLYLIHMSWGRWLIAEIYPHLSVGATFGVVTATMLLAAYLIHRLVERPFGPRLRRALERDLSPGALVRQRRPARRQPSPTGEVPAVEVGASR
jgi:peptidoglycan/LPS O-acetylase OafA/YrhL